MAVFGVLGATGGSSTWRALWRRTATPCSSTAGGAGGRGGVPHPPPWRSWDGAARWWCCPCPLSGRAASSTPPLPRCHPLDDSFAAALAHCLVLGGMVGKLRQTSPLWETIPLEDYYQREELTVGNAFLTAEGALALAVEHAPGALGALGVWWRALGALARRCAWICAPWAPRWTAPPASPGFGRHPGHGLRGPHLWPGERPLRRDFQHRARPCHRGGDIGRQGPDTLLLELASAPGGICRRAAQARGLRLLDCPSLPGRFSPKASGELVKEAVYHILEERRKLS